MKPQKATHTPMCKKALGKQTQFDLTCNRCNKDSYDAVTALRPIAEKWEANQKATHTPGPWHIGKDGKAVESEHKNYEGEYMDVARARTEEDARLIAAAPELLETLKVLFEGFKNDMKVEWRCHVRDLIAKAEGK